MTALSKATLKATWVANFKPRASDFANLIDSWTDYYASLEAVGAAVVAGSRGIPAFTGSSTVTFLANTTAADVAVPVLRGQASATIINIGNATSLIGRYGFQSTPQDRITFTSSTANESWFDGNGLRIESVGTVSAPASLNYVIMRSYDPFSSENEAGNGIVFFRIRGTAFEYSNPANRPNTALASGRTIGEIVWATSAVSGLSGAITPAAIRTMTTGAVTQGNCPTEIIFYVRSSGQTDQFNRLGRQFSVGDGFVHFQPVSGAPASPRAGMTYYDSSTNKLRCYNGTSWNDLF